MYRFNAAPVKLPAGPFGRNWQATILKFIFYDANARDAEESKQPFKRGTMLENPHFTVSKLTTKQQ